MRRAVITGLGGSIVGILLSVGVLSAVGGTAPHTALSVGPAAPRDTGPGEYLLLVLGGSYGTKAEADAANGRLVFGDLQGFYVVPTAQFEGLREQLGTGDWALVSAFRTVEGAQAFASLAQGFGVPATILPTRFRSLGGVYAGLGQEEDPNGTGPLLHPTKASLRG